MAFGGLPLAIHLPSRVVSYLQLLRINPGTGGVEFPVPPLKGLEIEFSYQ